MAITINWPRRWPISITPINRESALSEGATQALECVLQQGRRQGLLANGQCFTIAQLQRALKQQQPGIMLHGLLNANCVFLSTQYGVKVPSPTFFARVERGLLEAGFTPENVLVVSSRLRDHLAVAKRFNFRTALYAADANSCKVEADELKSPEMRPDRLLTELAQISDVLAAD